MSTTATDFVITVRGSSAKTIEAKAAALDRLAASVGRTRSAFGAAGVVAPAASRGITGYTKDITKATERTDAFGTKLRGAGNALDNFRTLFTRMIRIMSSYWIISQVQRAVKEFLTTLIKGPAQMELWATQLRVLAGNATLASEQLELLKRVAIETPLELPDLFQGLTTLQAFDVEISERTLPLLADLAAVSGRTFEEVAEVVGKVIQGSPTAITRSLPTLAINPNEFKALAAELGSRSDAIFQIIDERFKGFAKESATTVLGIFSNIKDALFVVLSEIGSGMLSFMRQYAQGLMDWLMGLRENRQALEELRSKVRAVVAILLDMGGAIVRSVKWVWEIGAAFGGWVRVLQILLAMKLVTFFIGLAASVSPIGLVAWGVVLILATLTDRIADMTGAFDGWSLSTRQAIEDQRALCDELQRTNRLLNMNIGLVDAEKLSLHARDVGLVASTLQGWIGGDLDNADFRALLERARMVAESMGGDQSRTLLKIEDLKAFGGIDTEVFRRADPQAFEKVSGVMQENLRFVYEAFRARQDQFAQWARQAREAEAGGWARGTIDPEDAGRKWAGSWGMPDMFKIYANMKEEFYDQQVGLDLWEGLRDRFSLGMIEDKEYITGTRVFVGRVQKTIEELAATGDPIDFEVALRLKAKIEGFEKVTEQVKKATKSMEVEVSEAMKTAILSAIQRGVDALADALGSMIAGEDISDALTKSFAAILNTFGDMLIQLGLAKLAFDDLIKKIISMTPGGGLAAIAAGIALKALAKSITSSMNPSGGGGGGGKTVPSGPVSYPTFSPSTFSTPSQVQVNITTMDAKGVDQFLRDNQTAFGKAVARVARDDRETGGAAFGAFAFGR